MGRCYELQHDRVPCCVEGLVEVARKKTALAGTTCDAMSELDALSKGDQNKLNLEGLEAAHSVDIDACFQEAEPNAFRWDYYIGLLKRKGELYVEVHEVSEGEVARIQKKAEWLRAKVVTYGWPSTPGRPLFVAPTKGISPFALYGTLSKRLALSKITVVMKGDCIADLLD
jgi:hypothetical protein